MDQNSPSAARRSDKRNTTAKAPGSKAKALNGAAKKSSSNEHAQSVPELDQHQLLNALHAMQAGDFSVRLPGHQIGVAGKICDAFNTIGAAHQRIGQQL